MSINRIINPLRGLGGQSILVISTLITVISIILSLFFLTSQKNSVRKELEKRARALSDNLAYNSQYWVYTNYTAELSKLITGVMNEEEIVYAYIVDASDTIRAHNDTTLIGKPAKDIPDYRKYDAQLSTTESNHIRVMGAVIEIVSPINKITPDRNNTNEEILFGGEGRISTGQQPERNIPAQSAPVNRLGDVHLGVSLEELNHEIAVNQRKALIITFGVIMAGILILIVITRFVTRPLRELADATQIVAQGNLDLSVDISRKDEIGILARSFNRMIGELKKSRAKTENWNRVLEARVIERTKELSRKNLELKKYSEELQKALEELKTLDKSKDDFLSLVSHELRTPLSSIVAYTEVLLDEMAETEEDEKKYLGIIKNESDRLTRLINNVLDLSKMEAGRMPFAFKTTKLTELIETSIAGLTGLANKHRHTIVNKLENLSIGVNVDPDKIIQVMSNIISNAIKFSRDGGVITISGHVRDNMVELAVADTGIGIKKKDITKVFDKFQQIEDVDHHSEGSGLGMPISKLIIENHHGKIWLESTLGKGTTFYFTLPVAGDERDD